MVSDCSSIQGLGGPLGVVALISFTLFGIEEIGIEIENPFGYDPNDLPLDTICTRILSDIEDLILTPGTHSYHLNVQNGVLKTPST